MLPSHAVSAGVATFTGVWCLFLSMLAPIATVDRALHHEAVVARSPKTLAARSFPSVLPRTPERGGVELLSTEPAPEPAKPLPRPKPATKTSLAASKHQYLDRF